MHKRRALGPRSAPGRAADAAADVEALRGADVIIRVEPGEIRVWDFADEYADD